MLIESFVKLGDNAYLSKDGKWLLHIGFEYKDDNIHVIRPRETLPVPYLENLGNGDFNYHTPTPEDFQCEEKKWTVWLLGAYGGGYSGSYDTLNSAIERTQKESS